MNLDQLRCFVAVAEELHFGRAARQLNMHPAALGRSVRLLEDDLGSQLLVRTTRQVNLTETGSAFLNDARSLLAHADGVSERYRAQGHRKATVLRLGAIDTASAGLVPALLHDFKVRYPDMSVQLIEDKSVRLLPRLLSGRLDLAFVRPPNHRGKEIEFLDLVRETAVCAVPTGHRLADRETLTIAELAEEPLIVPDRRSRPHSHDLTLKLFDQAGLRPAIAQIAEEKQTIIHLVATGFGIALVPRWATKIPVTVVRFLPLDRVNRDGLPVLPLAAAWMRGTRDPVRDALLELLTANHDRYFAEA